ncbi:MAG: hypothetical protein J6Y25_03825 [Elusimicrobiaceae bacterium]|nr:hypothetical protein [Elusimicrobiaceae bacterium]
MNRDILSLDFYGEGITAALASLDERTDTLRIRHIVRQPCRALSGAFVRDISGARDALSHVLTEMDPYMQGSVSVVVGVRGSFLSFRRGTGFINPAARNHIIHESDIEEVIHASLPSNLSESLEVVDIYPQSYTIDDQAGVIDPCGMQGYCLEAQTFISLGVGSHLANLNHVLSACGCEDYLLLPTVLALGETVLTPTEKAATALLVDIGESGTSALLYHKDMLLEAWELPCSLEQTAEEVADLLQNDIATARQLLRTYEPDPVMDELLEDACAPMVQALHKELVHSLNYIQHPPTHLILCGQGANTVFLRVLKNKLATRKARLCSFDHLIADCDADLPVYNGALALLDHALTREQNQLGVAQVKQEGILGKLFSKFGLN